MNPTVFFALVSIFLFPGNYSYGQETLFEGKVIDHLTKQPITYATIEIKTLKSGTYSDSAGNFSILYRHPYDTLEFNSLGYEMKKYSIGDLNNSKSIIELEPHLFELKEVVVVPKKLKQFD